MSVEKEKCTKVIKRYYGLYFRMIKRGETRSMTMTVHPFHRPPH